MISSLIQGIFNLVISLVEILLLPLDAIIETFLPDLSNGFTYIQSFLALCCQFIGWVVDALGIPSFAINLIILFFTFKIMISLTAYPIKLALKWYDTLKT